MDLTPPSHAVLKTTTEHASLARLPTSALVALAPLRNVPGVAIRMEGDQTWVSWPAYEARVASLLLPLAGVALFVERGGLWYPPGSSLPLLDGPPLSLEPVALSIALTPERVEPIPASQDPLTPITLTLKRDGRVRPTSALRCPVMALKPWADSAPSAEIEAVRGAHDGLIALLMSEALPPIAEAERFWGSSVLIPLGFAPRPGWDEASLRQALGIAEDQIALIHPDASVETIPRAAFQPMTRAGIRLAIASMKETEA